MNAMNWPVVYPEALLLVMACALLMNLLIDLLYRVIDPRVRLS